MPTQYLFTKEQSLRLTFMAVFLFFLLATCVNLRIKHVVFMMYIKFQLCNIAIFKLDTQLFV
jgi:hypothetical protein